MNIKNCIAQIIGILFVIHFANSQTTSDCGTTYGCFKSPANCSDATCLFIFKWQNRNPFVDFTLYTNPTNYTNDTNLWLGIGFSTDNRMGNDSVVICTTDNQVKSYYNPGYVNPTLIDSTNPTLGISNPNIIRNNSWLQCSFSRQITNNANSQFFDLTNKWFVLGAFGTTTGTTLNLHLKKRETSVAMDFSTPVVKADSIVTTTTTTTQLVSVTTTTTAQLVLVTTTTIISPVTTTKNAQIETNSSRMKSYSMDALFLSFFSSLFLSYKLL